MSTINIKLYDMARLKLNMNEADAREFVESIDEAVVEDIKASTINYKSLWKEDFFSLDKKLSALELKIAEGKNDMIKATTEVKSEMLKWFFGFFIALALMIIGTYFIK